MVDTGDSAAGWDAIDAALRRAYPDITPRHYGTLVSWALGGPDPLDGVSVHPRDGHWHFVSYGMSELYGKRSDDADGSGWGFEFTFRVARPDSESEPPMWAVGFLQNLARYVFSSGNAFAPGHHVDLNGPIAQSRPDTAIRAIAFADDPELGTIDTPHGRVRFLQVVGLTLEEYAAAQVWDTERLLAILAPRLPLLVTDLSRDDLTRDPEIAVAIEEGVRREGSSTGSMFVSTADWRVDRAGWRREPVTTLTFGAHAAGGIGRILSARLRFGRGLIVEGPQATVVFGTGESLAVDEGGDGLLEVRLPLPMVDELIRVLRPVAGTYPLPGAAQLRIEIVKSQIRDWSGTVVAEVG